MSFLGALVHRRERPFQSPGGINILLQGQSLIVDTFNIYTFLPKLDYPQAAIGSANANKK